MTKYLISVILSLTLFFAVSTALASEGGIDSGLLENLKQSYAEHGDQSTIINAVTNNSIKNLSLNRSRLLTHDQLLSHKLKETAMTNQKGSGRCWLFAGMNVFSPKVMTALDMSDFEMSEPYLTFYDKLEKANHFLERIIETRDKPTDDRSFQLIIASPFGDGGWWNYVTVLVEKYGLVPMSVMPETKQSVGTGSVNKLVTTLLRKDAVELRRMHTKGNSVSDLRNRKEEMLQTVYRMLVYNYGQPPENFRFRWEQKEDSAKGIEEAIIVGDYTPMSFYKEFFADGLPNYIPIVNNPTVAFNDPFLLEDSRNITDEPDMTVLNLEISRLKTYALKMLLDSQVVWFGCDVGKQNYGDSGIFADGIYDYSGTFNMDFSMTKAERIVYKEISPNHAMSLVGVDTTSDGLPTKWLVKNSWGSKKGDSGYWYLYDDWFNEYVLMVIIEDRLLTKEDLDKLKKKPTVVPDWEPFFLALRNLE